MSSFKRDGLLKLLVQLSSRPHPQCLRVRTPTQRFALYSTVPGKKENTSRENGKPIDSSRSGSTTSKIPLHVGLDRNPEALSAISRIPIPKGEKGEKFVPSILARPLGLRHPPRPGQNSPVDNRTFAERKEEFTNYDKALERRRIYLRSFFRPYFQEWRRVDHFKGKSFVSNDRLFKRDKALYFPNIWGETLAKEGDGSDGGRDTTNVLMGKISIVGIQSGQWAEEQVDTFLGPKQNPSLEDIMKNNVGRVQRVDINLQGDWARQMLVKLFKPRLRQIIPQERWNRYFIAKLPRDIRKGLTEDIRDAMGLLNSQVGYVYLLDSGCRIRWAGSGHAWEGEVDGLNAAIKRLLQEEISIQVSSQITTN